MWVAAHIYIDVCVRRIAAKTRLASHIRVFWIEYVGVNGDVGDRCVVVRGERPVESVADCRVQYRDTALCDV